MLFNHRACALFLFPHTVDLWLTEKSRATFYTNQKLNQTTCDILTHAHVPPGLSACLLYLSRVLIGLFDCLLVLWLARKKMGFVLFLLRSFVKGFEKISVWCVLFFFLSVGLSASPSKSDPFAMDPFQSTFPSSKVSAMIILHFHQIGNLLRWSFFTFFLIGNLLRWSFTFKVHLAEQRSPFLYLISHSQST